MTGSILGSCCCFAIEEFCFFSVKSDCVSIVVALLYWEHFLSIPEPQNLFYCPRGVNTRNLSPTSPECAFSHFLFHRCTATAPLQPRLWCHLNPSSRRGFSSSRSCLFCAGCKYRCCCLLCCRISPGLVLTLQLRILI